MKTEETKELEKLLGIAVEEQEIPVITKYEDAEKAMDSYASAEMRIFERTAFVKARIELVMQRLEQLNAEDEKKKKTVAELLRGWGEAFVKKTKVKTVKFMRGQMSFKNVPKAVVVDDAQKASNEVIARRKSEEFTTKCGTVPMKAEIKIKEPEGVNALQVERATQEYLERIGKLGAEVKVKTEVGQREVAAFYEKTSILFEGCHVRPELENGTFKIEVIEGDTLISRVG